MPAAGVTGERVSAQRGAPGYAPRRALELRPGDGLRAAALGHVAEQLRGRGGVVGERHQGGVLAVVVGQRLGAGRRGRRQLREALGQQAGADEEHVVLGQLAQAGREPHGGRVLVRLTAARPSSSCAVRAAAAASAAIPSPSARLSAGASSAARSQASAAVTRTRAPRPAGACAPPRAGAAAAAAAGGGRAGRRAAGPGSGRRRGR